MSELILIESESKPATREEMLARISLLSSEIDANEEENKMMQDEITALYAELDKNKEVGK